MHVCVCTRVVCCTPPHFVRDVHDTCRSLAPLHTSVSLFPWCILLRTHRTTDLYTPHVISDALSGGTECSFLLCLVFLVRTPRCWMKDGRGQCLPTAFLRYAASLCHCLLLCKLHEDGKVVVITSVRVMLQTCFSIPEEIPLPEAPLCSTHKFVVAQHESNQHTFTRWI